LEVGRFLPQSPRGEGASARLRVQMRQSSRGAAMGQHQPTKGIGMKLGLMDIF
jgi:hypothetical protein